MTQPLINEKTSAPPEQDTGVSPEDRKTVLVVEDEGPLRVVALRQLTDLGYQVLEAEDADSALKLLESGKKIDLLFTDIVMPGRTNGMELARITMKRWPLLKVVLTSGTASGSDPLLEGLRLLGKPYLKKELDKVLSEVFDGAAQTLLPVQA